MPRISKKQQDSVAAWILDGGRREADPKAFFDGLNAAFSRAGVPVERAMFSLRMIHPQAMAAGFVWHVDRPTTEMLRDHTIQYTDAYLLSPIKRIHDGADFVHARLSGSEASDEFPL